MAIESHDPLQLNKMVPASKPWNSLDALSRADRIHTCDKQEYIDRCLSCPRPAEKCTGGKCWFRLGYERKRKK